MISSLPACVRGPAAAWLLAVLAPTSVAQTAAPRPEPYALTNVKLSTVDDAPTHTILLEQGRIRKIQYASEQVPAHARVIDCEGMVAVPAFLDAYGAAGCETPTPVAQKDDPASVSANAPIDMRQANRKGIQPSFRAADVYTVDDETSEGYRKQGFGAHLSAPRGQILAGRSAFASTRDAAPRDVIARGDVFHHAAFSASGSGYPTTLMAYHAQFRQYFLDARRHAELKARFEAGRPGPRPPFDADLEAAAPLLAGERILVCEARTHRDVRRWIALADEFGIRIAISGGREIQEAVALLVERDIPVFMTLDWGDEIKDPREEDEDKKRGRRSDNPEEGAEEAEPDAETAEEVQEDVPEPDPDPDPEGKPGETDDTEEVPEGEAEQPDRWKYEEPMPVRIEKRLAWEKRRDCALRLQEAGVRVVFGTGTRKPADLLKSVRTLVENGYPQEAALAGLTSGPAELLGVDRHFGWLKEGHAAQIALWTAHPFEEGAQVKWMVVDGFPYEFDVEEGASDGAPAEGVDVAGTWDVADPDAEEERVFTLELEMSEAGSISGSATIESPFDGSMLKSDVSGKVGGERASISISMMVGDTQVDLKLEGKVKKDVIKGDMVVKFAGGEQENRFEATRRPGDGRTR